MTIFHYHNHRRWTRDGYLERVLAQSARCVLGLSDARRACVLAALLAEARRIFFHAGPSK